MLILIGWKGVSLRKYAPILPLSASLPFRDSGRPSCHCRENTHSKRSFRDSYEPLLRATLGYTAESLSGSCFEVLLHAGADPTINISSYIATPLFLHFLRNYMESAAPLVSLYDIPIIRYPLTYLSHFGAQPSNRAASISTFEKGSAEDVATGWSCAHHREL